jgi:copper chaperone CopZ
MKKVFLIVFLLWTVLGQAQFKSATLQASGLTCAMCSNAINKSLKTLSFVEKVDADIANSSFLIIFRQGTEINFDQLRKKVEDAGFSVAKLQIVTVFNNTTIENDQPVTIDGKQFHFLNVKNQVLNGEQIITIVDKSFVPVKEYKKFAMLTKAESFKTGQAKGTRIYHVTI